MIDCLHPVKVFNPSLGRFILVSCGKCLNCLANNANRYTSQCAFNERHHRFTMFLTLTYNDYYLPYCEPIHYNFQDGSLRCVKFINRCRRLRRYIPGGVFFQSFDNLFDDDINFLYLVSAKPIGFLFPKDAQNFLKRFRKYAKKFLQKDITFHYFLAGEYGETRFRPHFHLLLFFDDFQLYDKFGTILHKAWKFGFVDYSLSRGGVSSYVASYINGLSSLPSLLLQGNFKPRRQHSIGFSKASLAFGTSSPASLETYGFGNLVNNGKGFGAEVYPVFLSSYDASKLFPKLPYTKYSFSNVEELCFLYKFYSRALYSYINVGGISNKCSDLANYICYLIDSDYHSFYIDWICSKITPFQKKFDFVYRLLLTSKRFLLQNCKTDLTKVRAECERIIRFYNARSLHSLSTWYQEMDDCIKTHSNYLLFFYDNFLTKNGNIYHEFRSLSDFHLLLNTFENSDYYDLFCELSYKELSLVTGSFYRSLRNSIKLQKHKQLNNTLYEYNE